MSAENLLQCVKKMRKKNIYCKKKQPFYRKIAYDLFCLKMLLNPWHDLPWSTSILSQSCKENFKFYNHTIFKLFILFERAFHQQRNEL